jgi:hypothetical protein
LHPSKIIIKGDGAGGDPEEVEEALNCTKEALFSFRFFSVYNNAQERFRSLPKLTKSKENMKESRKN